MGIKGYLFVYLLPAGTCLIFLIYNFVFIFFSVSTPEKLPCRIEVSGQDQGTLSKEDIANETLAYLASKDMPIDCIWVIIVKDGWRVSTD